MLGALASAAPALAHAELVAADPAPGIGLARAPGAVVLRFSEALNVRLSRIEVVDRSGHEVGLGQAQAVPGDPRAMQEKLGPVPLGVYTVRWTSTSADDGHTLQGSYSFGVATAAAGNETVANNPASSEGWLGLFGRLVAVIGLALWAGSAGIGHLASRAGLPDSSLRRIRRLGPLMVLVGTAVSFASSALVSAGSLAAVATVASSSLSGALRAALVGLSAVGFIGIRSPRLTLMLAAGAVLAEAASGHAASAPLPGLAVAISAIHLAAVGIWVFAIVASAFSANAMEALATFSPFAVGAAVAVAVSGIANAAFDVGRPAALASTPYGKLVVAKVVAFGLMVAFGLSHYWRRRRARGRGRTLRMPLRFEAGAAALALVLASALLGFPDPAREVGAQPRVTPQTDPALLSLGKRDALSLAEASGPFVVALTLLPPTPGPVELRVQVLGVEAGD
ncbi:MAG TPA: copper resistance protein CopC, partial [Actinomycetota bacterium]|nr:copper resistance protein CopC [Actinomycetota bacterium]